MQNANKVLYEKRIGEVLSGARAEQRIVRFFPDVSMRNGHQGLSALAKKEGIDVFDLEKGEYAIFVNKRQDALKLYAPGNVIAHLKMPGNARLDLRIISLVPRFFNGSKINYDAALEEVLRRHFSVN